MKSSLACCGLLLALVLGPLSAFGELYYVYLKDKPHASNVCGDFSQKALDRRIRQGIPFPTWEDQPVDPVYLALVGDRVDSVRHVLRWWNAISVQASPAQAAALAELPCVLRVEAMEPLFSELAAAAQLPMPADSSQLDRLYYLQRRLMHLDSLPAHGLDGRGVRIAIFDAGFKGADEHPGLAHLFQNGQVLSTKDFYAGRESVYRHNEHGTAVLSCIAGMYKGRPIGAAPAADFLLARTEHGALERYKEEDAWLAAMEWADREGADIISSSLGYGKRRYVYADMDGRTTKVTQAARMACRKGILVVNSAGNNGNEKFKYITAPGDADSVLTVGASQPMLRYPMRFTAFGPNAVGVAKPDVSAPGYVVACNQKGGWDVFPGTSFSCPLVAGLAACLLQLDTSQSNMQLHQRIRDMGHLNPYFDYRMGTGVPDAAWIFHPRPVVAPTFEVQRAGDSTIVLLDSTIMNRAGSRDVNGKPFHYEFVQADGRLSYFSTLRMRYPQGGWVIQDGERPDGRLRVWFEGYMWEESPED